MKNIVLTRQPSELYKVLKFESLVSSGGEAKMAIANGHVRVNGEVETRKRKKIRDGDIIEFDGDRFRVQCDTDETLKHALSDTPGKTPLETLKEGLKKNPQEFSGGSPQEITKDLPEGSSKEKPERPSRDQTAGKRPGRSLNNPAKDLPKVSSRENPEVSSRDQTSGEHPGRPLKNRAKDFPKETMEKTHDESPDVTRVANQDDSDDQE